MMQLMLWHICMHNNIFKEAPDFEWEIQVDFKVTPKETSLMQEMGSELAENNCYSKMYFLISLL